MELENETEEKNQLESNKFSSNTAISKLSRKPLMHAIQSQTAVWVSSKMNIK